MASTIGVRIAIDGDSSGAKRAVDDVNASFKRLNDSSKNLPSFMGTQVPSFNSNARYVPPLTQPNTGGLLLDARCGVAARMGIAQDPVKLT